MAYALVDTIGDEDTLTTTVNTDELSWDKPTLYPNGSSIPGSTITGYKIYEKDSSRRYSLSVTWSGGQSALSDSVSVTTWVDTIAAPIPANTVDAGDSQATIQAMIDGLTAGDVMYFSDSAGDFVWTTTGGRPSGTYLTIDVDGAADDLITFMAVPGETPIFQGLVWADEVNEPTGDQVLLEVTGDYIRLYGMEIKESRRWGVVWSGSNGHMEENNIHDCWDDCLHFGNFKTAGNDVTDNLVQYNKFHHSRTGYGVNVTGASGVDYNVDDNTFRRNISYRNGFNSDDTMNAYLGGNSDGFLIFKDMHRDYEPGGALDPVANSRENRCRGTHFLENIVYRNADDGVDVSPGLGTIIQGNIAFHNGPSGSRGYKIFEQIYEEISFVCNISLGSTTYIHGSEMYWGNLVGGESFSVSDTVEGSVSGATLTVDAVQTSTHLSDEGILTISSVSGTFVEEDDLEVSATKIAEVLSLGVTRGCDLRVNQGEATRSYGIANSLGFTCINHDSPGTNESRGMLLAEEPSTPGDFYNLLSYNNETDDNDGGATLNTSHINTNASAPDIDNINFTTPTETLSGTLIQDQWRTLYREVLGKCMPTVGGNVINAGTAASSLTAYYHTQAADNTTTPSDPDDNTKAIWTGTSTDIGAVAEQKIFPPTLSIVAGSGESMPPSGSGPQIPNTKSRMNSYRQ